MALKAATQGLGRAAADAATGGRGAMGMRLAGSNQVGPWRRGSEGLYQFDVRGPGRAVYTVRMPAAKPLEASCT